MKKIVVGIILLMATQKTFATDSVYKKSLINIFLEHENNKRPFLKLANKETANIDGNFLRYYYQLELTDTGTLFFFLYTVGFLEPRSVPQNETLISIPINFTGERWLYFSSKKNKLAEIKKNPLKSMSTEDFKNNYPIAYRKFKRRGFDKIFKNVQVNVEPNRNED